MQKSTFFFLILILLLILFGCVVLFLVANRPSINRKAYPEQHNPDTGYAATPHTLPDEIDLVYTWVDGSDPKHFAARGGKGNPSRFSDHGELEFSVQASLHFMPWIRKIFIVCADYQRPEWVSRADPTRIEMVPHSVIFGEFCHALPTFNSKAIESRLHHIPGLAEHFIYSNDDFFVGCPTPPSYFFDGKKPICRFSFLCIPQILTVLDPDNTYLDSLANMNHPLLDEIQYQPMRHALDHQMQAFTKSSIKTCAARFRTYWDSATMSRFRDTATIVPLHLAKHLAIMDGQHRVEYATHVNHPVVGVSKKPHMCTDLGLFYVEHIRPHLFCLNDENKEDDPEVTLMVREFLSKYFFS